MSPHLLLASAQFHDLVLATAKKTTTSSGASTIIFILFIGAIAYFLLIRPQRRRARAAQQNQQTVQIGDEVMLTSGIIGRITWLEGDRARLEIAPGTEVEVVRAAIGRQLPPPVADEDITVRPDEDYSTGSDHPDALHLPYGDGGEHTEEPTSSSAEDLPAGSTDDGDEIAGS